MFIDLFFIFLLSFFHASSYTLLYFLFFNFLICSIISSISVYSSFTTCSTFIFEQYSNFLFLLSAFCTHHLSLQIWCFFYFWSIIFFFLFQTVLTFNSIILFLYYQFNLVLFLILLSHFNIISTIILLSLLLFFLLLLHFNTTIRSWNKDWKNLKPYKKE